jgi:hypothetical protein
MKRLFLSAFLLLSVVASGQIFPVTDNFSGSGLLSTNWTDLATTSTGYVLLTRNSGTVITSVASQQGMAIYTGATFNNDQYSQVKFVTHVPGSGSSTGPCVRMNTSGSGVCYLADVGQMYLMQNGGGLGNINSSCPIPATGDTIELSVTGATFTCTDVTTGATSSTSDTTYSSGSPAILVDQRPSVAYALAQFQADCIPTCNTGPAPGSLITFTPPAGTYTGQQDVAISTKLPFSTIYYTTDGTPPTTSSLVYTSPVAVSTSLTLNAIAVVTTSGSAAYNVTIPATAAPVFNPVGGTYSIPQQVSISTTTPFSTIFYTTDGSDPHTSPTRIRYVGPFTVSLSSTTVNAYAMGDRLLPSPVSSVTYNITTVTTGNTWYVNGGGGTRYSSNQPGGQCNGTSPNPYPGSGVNQNCAFNDIRYLWTDASYQTDTAAGAPGWGWIGSSGDTYLIDCTGGAKCRIGQDGPGINDGFGLFGNTYAAGAPAPISGTANAHTKIFGINYQSCSSAAAKAHVNGGYAVSTVFNLGSVAYVDFACFDITDFSSCGQAGQTNQCSRDAPFSDFASNGIQTNRNTTHTTITDVNIHGMANNGMFGPTGTGVVVHNVTVAGNAASGWNMDDNSGTTGTGLLLLSNFSTIWNGCAEEYPVTHTLPYADCTDQNSNGYGDGIGTATYVSSPAWVMVVDHSTAAYNTQDGFDLLHLQGGNTTLLIGHSLAYGNMGQQVKMGAAGLGVNNLIVGNCNAMREAIPGTPAGYNSRLSLFCRAGDTPVVLSVSDVGIDTTFIYNTIYSANSIAVEVSQFGNCTTTCFLDYENNILVGFKNAPENGYPGGGTGGFPTPMYFDTGDPSALTKSNRFTNNVTFNQRTDWACPHTEWNEQNAICSAPGLVDETWHLYGFGDMSVASSSSTVVGRANPISYIDDDIAGATRSTTAPTIGAYEGKATAPPEQ